MKHVGLNVAADPLFTMSYTGVNAGLVICVATTRECTPHRMSRIPATTQSVQKYPCLSRRTLRRRTLSQRELLNCRRSVITCVSLYVH